MTCPLCKFGESRGEGSFGQALSCAACLKTAQEAEALRVKKREDRGGTCDACKKRKPCYTGGGNLTPTGAYRSEHLCLECLGARIGADMDQAKEAFKRFQVEPGEPISPDEEPPP